MRITDDSDPVMWHVTIRRDVVAADAEHAAALLLRAIRAELVTTVAVTPIGQRGSLTQFVDVPTGDGDPTEIESP